MSSSFISGGCRQTVRSLSTCGSVWILVCWGRVQLLIPSRLVAFQVVVVTLDTWKLYTWAGQYEYFSLEADYNYLAYVFFFAFQVVVVAVRTPCPRAGQYEYLSLEVESNYLANVVLLHFRWLLIPSGFWNSVHLTVSMNTFLLRSNPIT